MSTTECFPIVVLGEKDHGKSTLIGRLIFETRSLPEDRMKDVRKAIKVSGKKFEWAHLLDSFRYEREHEMTLDTTRAMVNLGVKLFECIDVPGHKELIKNMLTGAGDAKFALLIIDIRAGIKPQTLKHLDIAEFLGIEKLIIAVNKVDAIGYSQTAFDEAKEKFSKILENRRLAKKASIIPVSAFLGNNLIKRTSVLGWYSGPTLCQAMLKTFRAGVRKASAPGFARSAKVQPVCIFIRPPIGKIILESEFKNIAIKNIAGFQKINEPQKISLEFGKPQVLENRFVIKQKGRIIGICKKAAI